MKEIAPNVYIEQNSIGLYTGMLRSDTGMVLIDSPLKAPDGGFRKCAGDQDPCCKQCYMIVLDTNYDRLLSIKGSDCVIVAQSDAISPIRSRPTRISDDSQSNTENPDITTAGSRMLLPEIIYDNQLTLHVDNLQVDLEHHPGSNYAGTWVEIPERKVVFVGDTVVVDQPPFLAYANLEAWDDDLKLLLSKRYKDYLIVSSRSGVVSNDHINAMSKNITSIWKSFQILQENSAPIDEWYSIIPQISARFSQLDLFNSEIFYNRLHWGISTYFELNRREKG